MSFRKVRSPEAPKMTTVQGWGVGRPERVSRDGIGIFKVVEI